MTMKCVILKMMKIDGLFFALLVSGLLAAAFVSCATPEERLTPPKSTSEYRLSDIENNITENPVKALHLVEVYKLIYKGRIAVTSEEEDYLAKLEKAAIQKLTDDQALAINEKRWDDAVSMARSLSALGITVQSTGMAPDIILAQAQDALAKGENLKAFLAAVRAN